MAEAKLTRKLLRQFASTAGAGEIDVFGSLAAAALATSTDPDTIQSLSNWLDGWAAEVVDDENPVLEDRNAVDYVYSWMLKTVFQMGIPEWLTTETYFVGSIVNVAGVLYKSKVNSNIGNAVTDVNYWTPYSPANGLNPQVTPTLATRAASTWTVRVDGSSQALKAICWSPDLALFCAISNTGGSGDQILTSPNGITWTLRTEGEANDWASICWSPELKLFCAVGLVAGANTHSAMTSPDGTTWTARTIPNAVNWTSVCWAAELGKFVAVSGNSDRIATSSDGVTWVSPIVAAATGVNLQSVCWSPQRLLLVAVASDGSVITSPDGTTWTARTASSADYWVSVCWAAELGLFIAVDGIGADKVMTSPDGITWTGHATPAGSISWSSICWAPEIGLLIAVGSSAAGIFGNVMSSPDGVTWTLRSAAQANVWTAVAWSPRVGMAAAVSIAGVNQIMTSKYVQGFTCPDVRV